MDYLYSSLKMPLFCIYSKNSEKCNRKPLSRLQVLFVHHLLGKLRPLLDLFLFIYIFKKSAAIICISFLLTNHVIDSLLEKRHTKNSPTYHLSLENMTIKQWQKIKSSIVDANNCFNGIFPFFDSLNCEFSSGFRLIDNFPSHFSFHQANHKDKESCKAYLCKLDEIFQNSILDPNFIDIISIANIKNNVATSISHVHSHSNSAKKTIHHTVNITSTEAELFTIRCRIN